jgi:pectinesterase
MVDFEVVDARYFIAKDIGFRNTAGANGHQSVAVRATGDYIAFYRCKMESFQDTLFTLDGLQFYRDCTISGTIDFIFGNSAAIFQNCKIVLRTPQPGAQNVIIANGKNKYFMSNIIFYFLDPSHNISITCGWKIYLIYPR